MTRAELTAELSQLMDNRLAIDIIAERHGCTYTDVILIIGDTDIYDEFDANFPCDGLVGKALRYGCGERRRTTKATLRIDALTDDIIRLYKSGAAVTSIAKSLGISATGVANCLMRHKCYKYGKRNNKKERKTI